MIYTIGYERRTAAHILTIAQCLDAIILDVRGTPRSRKPDFQKSKLEQLWGSRYAWLGDLLGNHGGYHVTPKGLEALDAHYRGSRNCLLMCMEAAPADCHRHHLIAKPLGGCLHIYDGEIIASEELQRALDGGDDSYEVADWLPIAKLPPKTRRAA